MGVVITHDTDAVSLGRAREIAYNLGKLLIRRERERIRMIAAGLRHRRSLVTDPYFGFPAWRSLEEAANIRSAFYLFVRPATVRRDLHDSRSSVLDPGIEPTLFREMADAGWEFGLHASIHARHHSDGLRRSRELVEELLGRQVKGLRHHYLALDWREPWGTFRQHAAAGFQYDTSIGWRDAPGFRAGTSLPYRPYDPESNGDIQLWELPFAVMDSQLAHARGDQLVEETLAMTEDIRRVGGCLVLNWHTEAGTQSFDRRGFVDLFRRVFEGVQLSQDAWVTTPAALIDHWSQRAAKLGH